jgi:hypothetical protein
MSLIERLNIPLNKKELSEMRLGRDVYISGKEMKSRLPITRTTDLYRICK